MMRLGRIAALSTAMLALGAAPVAGDYVVQGDGVIAGSVEGRTGRFRIDPGAPAMPILTKPAALDAGLKGGMFVVGFKVGPTTMQGPTAVARLVVDGIPIRRRVAWFAQPYAAGVDGVVGPGGLPADVVRFVIHAPREGERTIALPLVDAGGLVGGWGGLFAEVAVGGEPMKVRFDLHHPYTLASACAAQRIAATQDGALTGPVDRTEIVFGIERPVRRMTLARPLAIGPLALGELSVRVSDYGSAATIRDADATPDPEEIVVTGRTRNDHARDRMTIGLDQLERCSSLVFDKRAKVVRLSCM